MKHPNKQKLTKKQIIIISVVGMAVLACVAIVFFCVVFRPSSDSDSLPKQEDATSSKVDFNRAVTNVDGSEFKATYEAGSNENFAVRFTDLKCVDTSCSNVGTVRLGDQTLVLNRDYTVKQGSIIIELLANILEALKSGQYDLTIEVKESDLTITVGVKITVKNETPTCNNGQVLQNNECIEKQPEVGGTQGNTQDNSQGNNSSSKPSEGGATTPTTPTTPTEPQEPPRPEFNLNENYWIRYTVEQWKLLDQDGNVIPNSISKARGWCDISRTEADAYYGPYVRRIMFTSDRKGLTEAEAQEDTERWQAELGLSGYGGGGGIEVLSEWYCDRCGMSCGRW